MDVQFKGTTTDFRAVAYQYFLKREGYRNKVYKDIKGLDTVGVGHLVQVGDHLVFGQIISNSDVQDLFNKDYDHLQIEMYAQELLNLGYSYNMALAAAHFIWGHGLGTREHTGYVGSQLRAGLLAKTFDADSVQQYLVKNWDTHSPTNQRVNREDFTVGFSETPWTPDFH